MASMWHGGKEQGGEEKVFPSPAESRKQVLIERSQRMLHVEMSTESAMCGGITGRVSVGGIPLGVGMVAIGISFQRVKERSYFILISVSL